VAASEDKTGSATLGGDWTLEFKTGAIEADFVTGQVEQILWEGLLATFDVTLTTDTNPGGGGVAGDLRWAITQANAAPGADTITFTIAGAGPHTITLAALLPNITQQVTIDGWSEPDYAGTNPVIVINGNDLAGSGLTLTGTADGSVIRGLVIRNFGSNSADDAGIQIQSGSNNNVIVGNYIGRLNADGTTAAAGLENAGKGMFIDGGSNNTIGGTTAALRNIISGNGDDGISLDNNANGNIIQGNWIGQNGAGAALGNGDDGVEIQGGSSNNWVGGTVPGAGNVIRASADANIEMRGDSSDGNRILGNSIYGGDDPGIDLNDSTAPAYAGNGVPNPNDDGDTDTNTNQGQNYPVVTSAVRTANAVRITGEFSAAQLNRTAPNTTFRIELFANSSANLAGLYEGERYLGFFDVTTDATGSASFDVTFMAAVAVNERITATATDPAGNTSEFFHVAGGVPAGGAAGRTISGVVYHDVDGDANVAEAGTERFAGATVRLYVDTNGNNTPDAGDALVSTATTDANGNYAFIGLTSARHWVVVDSKTLAPSAGFNAGATIANVWAEQTYADAGGASGAGFTAADGVLFGGRNATSSDTASALATAEHIIRADVTAGDDLDNDFGFSFNVVTNTLAGDATDHDAGNPRTVQGS
jgi:hypothetical protein